MKIFTKSFFTFSFLFIILLYVTGGKLDIPKVHGDSINGQAHIPVCSEGNTDAFARCHARVIVDEKGRPLATASPVGYGPDQFRKAYNILATGSADKIIAIIDAYDQPNIKSDLDTYSSQYGIPTLPVCSGAVALSPTPCFQKLNQSGGTNYPAVNSSWSLEISLDVEVAHAVCPNCSILLVEANSNSFSDLLTAFDQAVSQKATAISNSYGSKEFSGETLFDSHFNHSGTAITFSAGDSGYGTSYPAASKYVTSVGGTTLNLNSDNTYNTESVWSGTGSGCSTYESKPIFQQDTSCIRRTIADVSADADPNTGASVYDSVPYSGQTGWWHVGGTSLSSPIIAAIYAMGNINSNTQANAIPYSFKDYTTNVHDVINGKNGSCRKNMAYLCTAVPGYDGPTGLGTPNGISAF